MVRKGGEAIQAEMRKLIAEGQATGEVAKDDPDQLLGGGDGVPGRLIEGDVGARTREGECLNPRRTGGDANAEAGPYGGKREMKNRRGVCYDAARVMMGGSWRPKLDEALAEYYANH